MNALARALYRAALLVLPADFRDRNRSDLERLFDEEVRDAAARGTVAWCFAVVRGVSDALAVGMRMRSMHRPRGVPHRRSRMLESTFQDVRLALRSLAKSPGFVLTAVVIIAVGVGANTSLFSVINAVLLRPPPGVEQPERLVTVYTSDYSGPPYGTSSLPDFADFRDETPAFTDAFAMQPGSVSIPSDGGVSETLVAEYVSGNYFDVLGVPMALGRSFSASERDPSSGAAVVVLGHGFWTRRFGADPGVIGRTLRVSGQTLTVVGVAAEDFGGVTPLVTPELWVPLSSYALINGPGALDARGSRSWIVVGRLRDDATVEQAQAQLTALAGRLHEAVPDAWTDVSGATRRISVVHDVGLPPQVRGPAVGFAALLLAVLVLTLMIACANIANLTLARASRRKRELAMKVALGAGRVRIIRQLLAESALVSVGGAAVGVTIALWLIGTARAFPPFLGLAVTVDLAPDGSVLAFSVLLTVLTILAVGLVPALKASRSDPVDMLKGERSVGGSRFHWLELRHVLVVAQVAASLVLLVGAGLMVKSTRSALDVDPGFAVNGVATLSLSLGREGYTPEATRQLFDDLAESVARLPDVEAVAYTDGLPMTPSAGRRRGFAIPGYEPPPGMDMEMQFAGVGPGFLDALGVQVVRGREFTEADAADAPRVVMVNESFARLFWPDEDPIGKLVTWGRQDAEVVGVAADFMFRNLQDMGRPAFLAPVAQAPGTGLTLVARTSGSAEALLPALRAEVARLDDRLPIATLQTMSDAIDTILLPQRVASGLLTVAGVLGILLAAAGLYGIVSFLVSQSTRDIGLRMALGARGADVVARIVGRGVALSSVGAAIGLGLAAATTRLMRGFLLEVSPLDPGVFALMAVTAVLVAALASYAPARRASAVDPMVALRHD